MLSSFFGASVASANPSGGTVRSGNVRITNVGGNTLHVEQMTQRAIVDWQRFGIGQGESVRFLQPNQLSVILNRVVGQDPSHILGNLSANGNVFLINPNGILFGPSSVVNVGGLVASTLNISNEDFLNGNYRFKQDSSQALASVVNQGTITITDGGYAVLMAPLVSNEGLIVANLGKVNLISGESVTLNFDGRKLINYNVGHMDNANPGTVVVDRETVSGLLANVIQDPTLTEAGSMVENADGTVSLVGMADTVLNNGTIRANGAEGQDAGKIVLDSGRLTVVGSEAVIEASGEGRNSSGGEVIAYSEGTMKLAQGATIEAKGSSQGGDGGFVDTSGKGRIILEDYVDASAVDGEAGLWLIDPEFLAIVSGGGGQLDGDTNVTVGDGGQSSSISENFLEGLSGTTNVQLTAGTQITVNDLADNLLSLQDNVSLTLTSNTGDILFADPNDGIRVGGSGSLTLDSGRDIYLGTLTSEGSGTINLAYDRNIVDGNGAGNANIIGDFLSFDATLGDLETDLGALEIAGFTNSDPLSINLAVGNGRQVDLISVGGANGNPVVANNLDISTGGVLTSGNLSNTDITVAKTNNLTLNGLQANNVVINATGNVAGGAAATDIIANSALIDANNINNLNTNVADLNVGARNNNSNISLTTVDSTLTDLTIRSNNSAVTVDGSPVTSGTGSPADLTYTDGATANSFTFVESATRDLFIGTAGVEADSVSIQTGGSILRNPATGGTITSDSISLTTTGSGRSIGEFTTPAPVLVEGQGGGATNLSVSVVNGPVNIEHTDGDPSFVSFLNPADGEANLLNVDDPNGDSFSSLSFTRSGTGDIRLGVLGGSNPLNSVSITALDGSILNSVTAFPAGATNIFSTTLNLVSIGGSVGLVGDPIEVSVQELGGQGSNGFFVTNTQELEVFSLVTDGNADAFIGATNGSLSFTAAGNILTTTAITDTDGEQNTDGYDVALNFTLTNGDLNVDGVQIDGNSLVNDAPTGRALVNLIAQNGSLVSDGGIDINVGADTDVHLTASGGVGTRASQLGIQSTLDSPGELVVDAGNSIGIQIAPGDFDVVTLRHNNADILVDGSGPNVDTALPQLNINSNGLVSTLNYENRTAGNDLSFVTANGTDINISVAGDLGTAGPVGSINANSGTVTIDATGSVFANAISSGGGSLELHSVGGDATIANATGLDLNTAGPGNVAGSLNIDNDSLLTIGQITVGGAATFTNSGDVTSDEPGVVVDLVADSLTVNTDAFNTTFELETDVNDIVLDDRTTAFMTGMGDFDIRNLDSLNSLTVESSSSQVDVVTTNTGGGIRYNAGFLDTSAPFMDLGTFNLVEDGPISIGTTDLNHPRMTDVNVTALGVGSITGTGTLTTLGNATFDASVNVVNLQTNVDKTLSITAQSGTIDFTDTNANGPSDLVVRTVAGQTVSGFWDLAQSTMSYDAATDRLLITDFDAADTNVTFQTDVDNINLDFADVGDCRGGDMNDLTLIA
ncbi:MAG: filamentous hemagglutinin N-terminal domain-containing protein, partial [Candidatus Eremiobacteraeota bacterium]|nr:filamentous hemagglutinin N-terminal domain-containing protein [Candidatus Eremiobacteraeota bacterium]